MRIKFLYAVVACSIFTSSALYADSLSYNFSEQLLQGKNQRTYQSPSDYLAARLSVRISKAKPGEKKIIVDPRRHRWSAYSADNKLLRSGLATSGAKWCYDIRRPCKTTAGTFRIYSLGARSCVSRKYPLGRGGAPMPYCMYFNGGQGLHGSYQLARANLSHGCVRISVRDARWLRFNFVRVGTKVIIKSY